MRGDGDRREKIEKKLYLKMWEELTKKNVGREVKERMRSSFFQKKKKKIIYIYHRLPYGRTRIGEGKTGGKR